MSHDLIALRFSVLWLREVAEGAPIDTSGGICYNLNEALGKRELIKDGYHICHDAFVLMDELQDKTYPLGGAEAYTREWRNHTLWKGTKRRELCAKMVPAVERLIEKELQREKV